ncbi:MAG: hypothetical protein Q8Q89_01805, partial [bacterium]|nr:hypothetical protein [bacterium]
ILEEKKEELIPVLDSETARTINDVLSDNEARQPMFHPRSSLYFADYQVAAKTGTTQDARDAWVVGYSPSISVGVWAGNNNNASMNKTAVSISVAGPIWHKFVEFVLKSSPPEEFTKPEKKSPEKPILRGVYRDDQIFKIDKTTKKLANIFTPLDLIEELGIGEIKSILTKLKKEDPQGPSPSNSEEDIQFKNWQWAINNWLQINPLNSPSIPKDLDNIHSLDTIPKIVISYPDLNKKITNLNKISIVVNSTFPLKEAKLFIEDELVSSISSIIGKEINFTISKNLSKKTYKIEIIVYDTMGNKSSIEKELTIN